MAQPRDKPGGPATASGPVWPREPSRGVRRAGVNRAPPPTHAAVCSEPGLRLCSSRLRPAPMVRGPARGQALSYRQLCLCAGEHGTPPGARPTPLGLPGALPALQCGVEQQKNSGESPAGSRTQEFIVVWTDTGSAPHTYTCTRAPNTQIYTYTHIYTYIHTHTHIYMYTGSEYTHTHM